MLNSILKHYAAEYNGEIKQGASGWNNTTYFIESRTRRSVLRIYETHQDREKIQFEHAVLEALGQRTLSFGIPLPVKTLAGETIVQTADGSGRYACMFEYMDGMRPEGDSETAAYSFGNAAGELVCVLAGVEPGVQPSYRPYYELAQSYPACTPEMVQQFCKQPPAVFHDLRNALIYIADALTDITRQLDGLEQLPQQLVHGDLNYSNLLVNSDDPAQVVALLDFEFCTQDVRAMEPAVIISGLMGRGSERDQTAVKLFCQGFSSRIRLAREEVEAIPALMRLRHIDVFLHFMSRFFNGTDGPEVLRRQVQSIYADLRQLEKNGGWLDESLQQSLIG